MTIERSQGIKRAGRFTGSLLLILSIWFATIAIVPRLLDEPGQYILVGPQKIGIKAVASTSVRLVSSGRGYIQIEGRGQGTVSQLYAAGAWLVLPASNGGCFSLRDWKRLIARARTAL